LFLQRLPLYIPARAFFLVSGIRFAVGYLEAGTTALSKYALVYSGLTGDPFMGSARRARALTVAAETRVGKRRGFNAERGFCLSGWEVVLIYIFLFFSSAPLTLLTVAPLTMTFPFALTTYLFVAHTLGVPEQALGAAILAGGVTALVGLFCVGLVKDT
jgi:Plasma-membrane choline transporter